MTADMKIVLGAFAAGFLTLAGLNLVTARWLSDRIDQHTHPAPIIEIPRRMVESEAPRMLTEAEITAIAERLAERLEGEGQ